MKYHLKASFFVSPSLFLENVGLDNKWACDVSASILFVVFSRKTVRLYIPARQHNPYLVWVSIAVWDFPGCMEFTLASNQSNFSKPGQYELVM